MFRFSQRPMAKALETLFLHCPMKQILLRARQPMIAPQSQHTELKRKPFLQNPALRFAGVSSRPDTLPLVPSGE